MRKIVSGADDADLEDMVTFADIIQAEKKWAEHRALFGEWDADQIVDAARGAGLDPDKFNNIADAL